MPKIAYISRRFNSSSIPTIRQADDICRQYAAQGLTLTLRQIYYQFVARGLMANRQSNYDRLGSILNDARLAGYLDWSHMEDRTRYLRKGSTWDAPQDILTAVASQYRRDLWADQNAHVEVWIEKDALVGVIERPCTEERVGYFACRGYPSQSEVWSAAMRLRGQARQGKAIHVLHLGDHDPSGIDMTRDIEDRLNLFLAHHEGYGYTLTVNRLALNMDQVEQYDPPPNPAKWSDSRAAAYVEQFGESSWELDALEPTVIGDLIRQEIANLRDDEAWLRASEREEREQNELAAISENYDAVSEFLNGYL